MGLDLDLDLLKAFSDELEKISATAAEFLGRAASRKGLQLPAIEQIKATAQQGLRPRAAEIAKNVRQFIKTAPTAPS